MGLYLLRNVVIISIVILRETTAKGSFAFFKFTLMAILSIHRLSM